MGLFRRTERERWASLFALSDTARHIGLPAFDTRSRELYETGLPRGVRVPRFTPDREPENYWMPPHELLQHAYMPGQIIIGKLAGKCLGHLDDRPMITIASARAGKTSTVLEPNLYLYPGSMLVLDPKGELAGSAAVRRALGHRVHVLDPFGQSGEPSASFNVLDELDPRSWIVVDDAKSITHSLIVDNGDARSQHWNDSARTLLLGVILLTLTLPPSERNLVTVRELLALTYPSLVAAVQGGIRASRSGKLDEDYYDDNRIAVQTLLRTMSGQGRRFGGILAAIGNRFLGTPQTERGSIFSTAAAQTDFLDSLPLRKISMRSDFRLSDLRGVVPTTIFMCLAVGRMESHFRWLRMLVQMASVALERMGPYPRERAPILYLMEEFAVLGHLKIMERAAAYFPGFGIKLWAILQNLGQLQEYKNPEIFLGNAGLIQCFANGDEETLGYIARRLDRLIQPFELRTVFSRQRHTQLLMMEGAPPAAAMRLEHGDVAAIRSGAMQRA
ncbi:MAG: type IV secretory system conjugative DNA transfer family protein [Xanthobacteraceae bacterium]